MKKFELIVGLIAILGAFLKILHIPGGFYIALLAFTTLSMFYYVFGFALFNGIRLRDILKKAAYAEYYKRIFKRISIYGSLGLILYLIPASFFAAL